MQSQIAQSWSMWLTRGIIGIVFGVVALVFPFATLSSLVILGAAFMLVDGIFAFVSLFSRRGTGQVWWSALFEALAGLGFGIVLLFWPGVALLTFLYFLASWAIISGVFEIVSAFRLRRVIEHEWALGFAGLASVLFGMALMAYPGIGLIAASWMLGAYAIIFGILMINTSINLKRELNKSNKMGGMGSPKPV